MSARFHHILASIKKFLCDDWLVRSLIRLALELKESVIKRLAQHSLDTGNRKNIAFMSPQSHIFEGSCDLLQSIFSSCIQIETFAYHLRSFGVNINIASAMIIDIADWCGARIHTSS